MEHTKIDFWAGDVNSAFEKLTEYKNAGILAYIEFNGQKLYSDTDDIDSAFMKVTGKTKAEFDEAQRVWRNEYHEEKRKHEESIPQLTKEWIEKGEKVLDEQYHEKWAKCVPIRLGDLYRGMELGNCLDIVNELNSGCTLEEAKKIIEDQGHSGMSFSLVCLMVQSFCKRGKEFSAYVK